MSLLMVGLKAAMSGATAWKLAKGAWIGGTLGLAAHRYYKHKEEDKKKERDSYRNEISYLRDKLSFMEMWGLDDDSYYDDYDYRPRRRRGRRYSEEMSEVIRRFM